MEPEADDPWLERRRKKKREAAYRRRVVLLVGITLFSILAAAAAVGLVVSRNRARPVDGGSVTRPLVGGPSATSEGERWDHRELAAYLRSRGMSVHVEPTTTGTFFGPACLFSPEADDAGDGVQVYVQKRKTAQEAKDEAGASPTPAFSWGCFLFCYGEASARYAGSVRSALGVR